MGKDDNTAGWILTTLVYALGGRMETGTGTKAKATLNNPQTVTALNMLQEDALDGQLDGLELRLRLERHQPGVRRRASRHVRQRLGRLHEPRPGEQHRPDDLRVAPIPLAKNKNAGVLGGGTLVAVRPDASTADEGGGGEVDRLLLRAAAGRRSRRRSATRRRSSRTKQPVGVPALPIFNKAQYDLANTWIKPYINVPQAQMKPFTTGIFEQKLIPEPEASTQSVYHALDAVVEAVLTDKNADIQSLLQQANSTAQAAISARAA